RVRPSAENSSAPNSVPTLLNTRRFGSSPRFEESQIDWRPSRSATKASARPEGGYVTLREETPRNGEMSTIPFWSRYRLSSWVPSSETNATAVPTGCPHAEGPGWTSRGGWRVWPPIASMCSPPRRTRSPRGPQVKGPGSVTWNRHVSAPLEGSSAHARPSATNATVWVGTACRSEQLRGSGSPEARSVRMPGAWFPGPGPPLCGAPGEDVQPATTTSDTAKTARSLLFIPAAVLKGLAVAPDHLRPYGFPLACVCGSLGRSSRWTTSRSRPADLRSPASSRSLQMPLGSPC